MSTVHFAQVISTYDLETGSRLLRCRMEEGASLGYEAGQYVIINSGIPNAEQKPLKRAYTIFGMNEERTEFSLLAERLPGGVVSGYLNDREVGDRLPFTGPWGKFKKLPMPSVDEPSQALCLAFGTGINALLGLFAYDLPAAETHLVWMHNPGTCFMSEACLRDFLPHDLTSFESKAWSDFEPEVARELLSLWPERLSCDVYLAGEGSWVEGIAALLLEEGKDPERLRKEVFYRLPAGG
jgi:ferredoxin-NADP reductase